MPRPTGIAYVPRRNQFLVAERQAGHTSILRLDLAAEPHGRFRLPRLSRPATLAFDPSRHRLTAVQGRRSVLAAGRNIQARRPPVRHRGLGDLEFRDPRATTFDPSTGRWFVLDAAADAVIVVPGIRSLPSQRQVLSLRQLETEAYGGLAFNPSDGLLYVLSSDRDALFALDGSGAIQDTYRLSSVDLRRPVAMTFAPSADRTDDPAARNLYIADAGDTSRLGGVTEVTLAVEAAAAVEVVTATHVQTIATSAWNPAAPDPSGVVYLPGPDRLAVVDSEVDEVTGAGYHGVNLWVTRRDGTVTDTGTTFPSFSKEPTGLGHDPATDTLFISDDSAKRIWIDTRGTDGRFGTSDDVVTSINTQVYGSGDTEDPEFDPVTGHLFFVDGVNREVYEIDPVNEVFGDADDVMTHFDVGQFGPTDWEGLGSDASRGTLLVGARTKEIYEVTKSGTLVRIIDASNIPDLRRISGLGMAPASDGSGKMNYWIVDRAVDNGPDPDENDGKLFEITVPTQGEVPPTVTLTTPADGSAVNGVVPVEAVATDNLGVTQVAFSVDGVSIGVDTNGADGWSATWDTTSFDEGANTLSATATDTIGQTGSDTNVVTVDRTPPTVSISSPGPGEQVSGSIIIQADASDANGVAQVEFFDGTTSIGIGTNGPSGWSTSWDTTGATDGDHPLSAVATDRAGNTTTSAQVTVSVDNAGSPPGTTLTFAPTADTFVEERNPSRNHGGDAALQVDGSPQKQILMTFSVSGIGAGSVARATLSMDAIDGSRDGGTAHRVADTSWNEMTVTWSSAPAHDAAPIGSFGRVSPGTRYEMDLTAIIGGDGAYSIKLISGHRNGADYVSREGTSGLGPRLEIELVPPADSEPPSATITQPSAGSVSDVTNVEVDATDDVGVVSVDVLVDGTSVGTDTSEPYSVAWDTRTATNGDHELVAVALDAAGNEGTSDPITVTVENAPDTTPPDPPVITAATPASSTRVDLSWNEPFDDVGVVSYSIIRDGSTIATTALTTYSDATVEPATSYVYEVTASDAAGNVSDPSDPANVTTPPPDPTSFVFAAGGDHGANPNTDASLAQLDASGADFYLALGDLDYNQTATDEAWCDYVKAGLPTLGPTFPLQLVVGNHEEEGSPTGYILNHTACLPDRMGSTPGPGSMYGVEYYFDHPQPSPLMRVVMIAPDLTVEGVYHDYAAGTARYQWLAGVIDDARNASIPWVVVGMHKNCLTAGVKSCEIGADLMNLLVDKKVDLVLQGHDHNYQRGKQLALDASSCPGIVVDGYDADCVVDDGIDDVYAKGAGTVLAIAGAFGQGGYEVSPADAEAAYFSESDDTTNGFVRFAVTEERIDATFVPSVGSFTDSFSIQSGAVPSADRTPPSVPVGLSASAPASDRVDLSWSPSTDGTGVAGYLIYRDGAYLASSSTTSYADTSVIANTAYSYSVVAVDLANNPSAPSEPADVTTPSSGGTGPLTFQVVADARIDQGSPDNNYGSRAALAVDASPVQNSLLRFEVSGVGSSTVTSAKLRLYNVNRSNSGGEFFLAEHNTWDESTVTWNTAPQALPAMIASLGAVEVGNWYEVDLTAAIAGDGIYTIRVQSSSSNGADYASKEGSAATVPQLVLELAG